jgi:hypothetical protein
MFCRYRRTTLPSAGPGCCHDEDARAAKTEAADLAQARPGRAIPDRLRAPARQEHRPR